jgi:1-hydroxycarotenoid 3,4-desaturase
LPDHHVIVVGAGVAGLVAAADLARRGMQVTVLERAAVPGGKLRQVQADGAWIDSGPTVFTMRWVFEDLFADAGLQLSSHLQLEPLSVLARHAWGAGGQLDLHADVARSADAIGMFSGLAEARRFRAFCEQARKVYDTLEGPYIRSSRPSAASLTRDIGLRGTAVLTGLGPFRNLWRSLGRHFHDVRLQQLFARYATYCGSSPFEAPATLMLVAQVEMQGVWGVRGGMIALARALAALAERQGATIRCQAPVAQLCVERGQVAGVVLEDGERIHADAVVFNGDVGALSAGRLGAGARSATPIVPTESRSLSALTWSIHAKTRGFELVRHNVFFDADYASEFRDIFGHRRLPSEPTVYVCAQDRTDAGRATPPSDAMLARAEAPERLLCLVNAPAVGDIHPIAQQAIDDCADRAFALLERCGLQVDREPSNTVITSPNDFERLFPATGGALYGRASHGWMSAFARPDAASALPGLYLAGGSAHPGPGVPMAALSGRLAAARLMQDHAGRQRRKRVVIQQQHRHASA